MATRKRKRVKRKKLSRAIYKTRIRILKGGRPIDETVAISTMRKDAMYHFKKASKDHGGYVYLVKEDIVAEREDLSD